MIELPTPGDRIGRFRLEAELGRGGMGVVFSAVEETLGRRVALKVIAPQFAHDPEFRDRFVREARAQASLDSSHVVPVFAHGEEDGWVYIATQLVPDGDLGRLLRSRGPLATADAVALIEQVSRGLSDAHEAGLVHRDIKPGNVLLRERSGSLQAYLADFGIARRVDAELTRIGGAVIVGTPSYMAPELHHGSRAGVGSDVYALGCLLWMTLTATPPFPGASEIEIVQGHLQKPVPQLAGGTPMTLATNRVLRIALAKDPGQRYPSAVALRDELRSVLRLPASDADRTSVVGPVLPSVRAPRSRPPAPAAPQAPASVPPLTVQAPQPPPQPQPGEPWRAPASWGPPSGPPASGSASPPAQGVTVVPGQQPAAAPSSPSASFPPQHQAAWAATPAQGAGTPSPGGTPWAWYVVGGVAALVLGFLVALLVVSL